MYILLFCRGSIVITLILQCFAIIVNMYLSKIDAYLTRYYDKNSFAMNSQYVCCVSINQTMKSLVTYIIKFIPNIVQSSGRWFVKKKIITTY